VQLFAQVEGICLQTKLLTDCLAAGAHSYGQEAEKRLNLPVNCLFVTLLSGEDQGRVVAEVFHIIQEGLKV
jgi:hypothetical protein